MIITISGEPGAGDTSLTEDLSRKLKYRTIKIGNTVKELAMKRGYFIGKQGDVSSFLKKMRPNEREGFNRKLDEMQRAKARHYSNCIVNGRVSAFNIPKAELKVFLTADEKVRARRVAKRDGISYAKALREIRSRERIERKMFKKMYGFDYVKALDVYDMVINTSSHERKDTRDMVLIYVRALKRRN